jgi:hypothetical protein
MHDLLRLLEKCSTMLENIKILPGEKKTLSMKPVEQKQLHYGKLFSLMEKYFL